MDNLGRDSFEDFGFLNMMVYKKIDFEKLSLCQFFVETDWSNRRIWPNLANFADFQKNPIFK